MNLVLPSLKWLRFVPLLLAALLISIHPASAGTKAEPIPPVIDEQPIGRYVSVGGHLALFVAAHGNAALTYQWRKGGELLTNSARLTGATNALLYIDPVDTNDFGDYSVVVMAGTAGATSTVATVTLNPVALQLTVGPGQGLTLRISGPVGDVYRIEGSANSGGPWTTNFYMTNRFGSVSTFRTFAQLPNFMRSRLDHMLPVIYTTGNQTPTTVRAYGKLNQAWRFEISSDFLEWSPIQTITNTTGWVRFDDPQLTPPPIRFYRITPP